MDCKRDVSPPERSKRKLKTPAQLEALEKFFNEHKYPSESRKLEFAKQIGLSEKQVSGWFCHRRLKDKRSSQNDLCTRGIQNLSNDAIHDLSSGLRQESCNSTKQSNRHYDSKEVESRTFDGHNSSVAFSASEQDRAAHVECFIDAEERSSGSSTASHERFFQQRVNFHAMKSRCSFWDASLRSLDREGVKKREYMMDPGSLCPKDEAEIPAVSFVKLKLGQRYCEDGPPLAVDFDPLPPGAFDSPAGDSNCGPYYVGDSFQLASCSPPLVTKEPKMYDNYISENTASRMFPNRSDYNRKPFHHQNDYSGRQLTPMSSITKNNDHHRNQTLVMNEREDTTGEASDEYRRNNGRWFKDRVKAESNGSDRGCFGLNGLKAKDTKPLLYPHSDYNYCGQREPSGFNISHPSPGRKGFLIIKGNAQPRRSLAVLNKKIDKEKKICKLQSSVRPQGLMSRGVKLAREVPGLGLQRPDLVMKGSQKCPPTKLVTRYSEDSASSSTEDETSRSTSSMQ